MLSITDTEDGVELRTFTLNLHHKAMFSVADASNVRFSCMDGAIWITLDNDIRDVILEAKGQFITHEHRRAVIYALDHSTVKLMRLPLKEQGLEGNASSKLMLCLEPT